jgi:DegV family protein with EDD domain
MDSYVIITDSSCDLPMTIVKKRGLNALPLSVLVKGNEYKNCLDEREITNKKFYALLREGETVSTSAVNANAFENAMEAELQQGKDVLVLAFSSGLSNTYNAAEIAANELRERYPERKILVSDTLSASMGQGLLVELVFRQQDAGASIEEAYAYAEDIKLRVAHWFTVDDLKHLQRGGRISHTAALLGTMLHVKPVLHVDNEGHLISVSKARGRRASLNELIKRMEESVIDPVDSPVFISHGDSKEDAQYLANKIKERLGTKEIVISYIGPVIGAHSGPGTIALFFVAKQR